jgi:hypothetical protein
MLYQLETEAEIAMPAFARGMVFVAPAFMAGSFEPIPNARSEGGRYKALRAGDRG